MARREKNRGTLYIEKVVFGKLLNGKSPLLSLLIFCDLHKLTLNVQLHRESFLDTVVSAMYADTTGGFCKWSDWFCIYSMKCVRVSWYLQSRFQLKLKVGYLLRKVCTEKTVVSKVFCYAYVVHYCWTSENSQRYFPWYWLWESAGAQVCCFVIRFFLRALIWARHIALD